MDSKNKADIGIEKPKGLGKILSKISKSLDISSPILNGIFGDYLEKNQNELAIQPGFYLHQEKIDFQADKFKSQYPVLTSKICIFVHGLVCDEQYWNYGKTQITNYGMQLQADLVFTPFYFRYNTGRHISQNGQLFSEMLEELVQNYPIPIDQIALIGHSMGGLVIRSGCHYGEDNQSQWLKPVKKIILIGSPHLGAPLEKFGNVVANVMQAIPRPYMQLAGEVTNLRSSGIKDLRFGNVTDEDWKDSDPDALFENRRTDIPLYQGATYYVISGTITENPENLLSQWFGDALVRKGSALGKRADGKDILSIAPENQKEYPSVDHIGLGHSNEVYQQLREWCTDEQEQDVTVMNQPQSGESDKKEISYTSTNQWRGLFKLLSTAVREGSMSIEKVQEESTDEPYEILEKLAPSQTGSDINAISKEVTRGIYKSIRLINKGIFRLSQEATGSSENKKQHKDKKTE